MTRITRLTEPPLTSDTPSEFNRKAFSFADSLQHLPTDANALAEELEALDPTLEVDMNFRSGSPLPTSDIGAIWHDDYGSLMTWQVFNLNGASYSGYASVGVGSLMLDTQSVPRVGYVKSGVTNLSRSAYAALRNWAIHRGVLVASGSWAAGAFVFKDNADGVTFTVADVRGEFPRFWDDGRGIDAGRAIGSGQLATHLRVKFKGVDESAQRSFLEADYYRSTLELTSDRYDAFVNTNLSQSARKYGVDNLTMSGGANSYGNVRPTNTALLASIKF